MFGMGVLAVAEDASTQPSDTAVKGSSHERLVAPFNKLADLSDDQKDKLRQIHADALDQEKAIRQKEHDDMMAVLSDDQRKELDDIVAKAADEKKASAEDRRAQSDEEKAAALKQQANNMSGATSQPSSN
jgi:hypothetical protein